MTSSELIIGIDLGTTNSVVAVLEGDQPHVIINAEGQSKTPSIVAFLESGEVVVGEIAKRQATVAAGRTISSVKRLMGRSEADMEAIGIQMPYDVITHDGQLMVRVGDGGYTPSQISAFILQKLKQSAEDYFGESLTKAIVTVPAYFDDLQRQATREAGKLAGLDVLRLVNEPTAAAMAYGLGKTGQEKVVVYDFGGGTFDVTVLEISDGTFQVMTSSGDTHLGGDDVDEMVVQLLLEQLAGSPGGDAVLHDAMTLRRLKDAAEKAKCELSVARQTSIHLPFLAQVEGRPIHLEMMLTREMLENAVLPLVERTIDCCRQALEDCALSPDDIDKVLLVGGSTRMPIVQEMVEEHFGIAPFKGINPDEIVALGAATQAGVMAGKLKEVVLLDVTPHSLGVEVNDGRVARVIEKNSTIPIKMARLFTTTEDNQDMVSVHVVQGEGERANECRSLGKFSLTGLQEGRAGTPRVQVTFLINSDGMVEVSAEDMNTRQQKSIKLVLGADQQSSGTKRGSGSSTARRRRATERRIGHQARSSAPIGSGSEVLRGPVPTGPITSDSRVRASVRSLQPSALGAAPSDPGTPRRGGDQSTVAARPTALAPPPVKEAPIASVSGPPKPGFEPESDADHGFHDMPTQSPDRQQPPAPRPNPSTVARGSSDPASGAESYSSTHLSPAARNAVSLALRNDSSPATLELFRQSAAEMRAYAMANPGDPEAAEAAVRAFVALGEQDAASRLLSSLSDATATDPTRIATLYDIYLARFPDSATASAVEARRLAGDGHVDEAILSLEAVVGDDKGSETQVNALVQLYRTRLSTSDEPATQFKLVKLLIRGGRVDEAISLLQRLVNNDEFRARALKILGLCFWQKGLHYLAWQKFQQLPITEELKDILYRLSADMEDTDQLLNAKVVLQHLYDADPAYKEVSTRLRKVEQLIRLESGDREGQMTPSIFLTLKDSRFAILEEINRGSMGIVYRAKDKVLEEIVALKILNDYMTGDPVAVERFKREARAAKRLAHPNIVRIHDMFEYGTKKLLSMEYIEGQDLKKLLHDRKRITPAEVASIGRSVSEALGYAHQLNIVHRDIKPANVMLTTANQIKVTDFGIAKFLLAGHDSTRSGSQIIGTPLYMSPEQIRGDQVDGRSDIYSLGATLYEMMSGRPPFLEGNIEYHHLHTKPAALQADVPEALSAAILKCLEKDAINRFQNTDELSAALLAITAAMPPGTAAA